VHIRVLYLEHDKDFGKMLRTSLADEGIEVTLVGDGEAAITRLDKLRPELVLLDLDVPGGDDLVLCRAIRMRSAVPVIAVSENVDPELPARALDEGADDFVTKPYELRELLARMRAHVRRARREVVRQAQRIVLGALVVDLGSRTVEMDGTPVGVTSSEFAVLAALANHAGEPVERERLLQVVHGTEEAAFERSIDVLISRLRNKLEEAPRRPRFIKTVRNVGYMLALHRT
jgi:two-component system response regulator RstA